MNTAIILASGSGDRFMGEMPKQFTKLAGLPILVHTLLVFEKNDKIDSIVVVTNEPFIDQVWKYARQYRISKVHKVVGGGETRQASSKIGIECCLPETDYVLIHDGVRPLLSGSIITELITMVKIRKAVDTVVPSADTIVEVDQDGSIENIPDRSRLRRGQTPQAFSYSRIKAAHEQAESANICDATDDCQLMMRAGHKVFTVLGDQNNIKITYPVDLHIADKLFQLRTIKNNVSGSEEQFSVLNGKVVVVIGGTSGIGKAVAKLALPFARGVYALGRHTSPPVDVLDVASIQNAFKTIFKLSGRIDYLVNCAGDLIRKDVANTTIADWDHIIDTNLKGCFLVTKAILPYFQKQHFGNIMFIGSSSYTRGRAGYAAYSSSKAGLVNFCQALAEEVAEDGVKVNVASPGRVNTPLRFRHFGKEDPDTLLNAESVGNQILHALVQDSTGSVFEIV